MDDNQSTIARWLFSGSIMFIYLFLYLPILVLILSFNVDPQVFYWKGFTTKWYLKLWNESEIWDALKIRYSLRYLPPVLVSPWVPCLFVVHLATHCAMFNHSFLAFWLCLKLLLQSAC